MTASLREAEAMTRMSCLEVSEIPAAAMTVEVVRRLNTDVCGVKDIAAVGVRKAGGVSLLELPRFLFASATATPPPPPPSLTFLAEKDDSTVSIKEDDVRSRIDCLLTCCR